MKKQNIVEFINATAIVASANINTTKVVRIKNGCPFTNITKNVKYIGCGVGYSYLNSVEGAQKRSGVEPGYKLDKTYHRVYDKFFNCHINDESRLYLRLIVSWPQKEKKFTSTKVEWVADNKVVPYNVVEDWLYSEDKPKKQTNTKQLANGIEKGKDIIYRLISVDSITHFKQGERIWNKE